MITLRPYCSALRQELHSDLFWSLESIQRRGQWFQVSDHWLLRERTKKNKRVLQQPEHPPTMPSPRKSKYTGISSLALDSTRPPVQASLRLSSLLPLMREGLGCLADEEPSLNCCRCSLVRSCLEAANPSSKAIRFSPRSCSAPGLEWKKEGGMKGRRGTGHRT